MPRDRHDQEQSQTPLWMRVVVVFTLYWVSAPILVVLVGGAGFFFSVWSVLLSLALAFAAIWYYDKIMKAIDAVQHHLDR